MGKLISYFDKKEGGGGDTIVTKKGRSFIPSNRHKKPFFHIYIMKRKKRKITREKVENIISTQNKGIPI